MSRQHRLRAGLAGLIVAAGLAAFPGIGPGVAAAADPLFVDWSSLLPGLAGPYDPSSPNICRAGQPQCVDAVIREMDRRFAPLAADCDHDAVFALTYLRTTQEYRRTIEDPAFFDDTRAVNHEDAVFADAYFTAYDDWRAGRVASVPEAWAIAFQAARDHAVSAAGDVLLGINAHVQRDLPYVLYSVGLTAPDGSSRKPDHDRVNLILNRVMKPVIAEIAQRFDPTIDDADVSGTTLDDTLIFQILPTWREIAWRNAERLAAAADDAQRAQVASEIEAYAATQARAIATGSAYVPGVQSSAARDAYCAVHHG
jgi:Family of unknown function (DUF5995)